MFAEGYIYKHHVYRTTIAAFYSVKLSTSRLQFNLEVKMSSCVQLNARTINSRICNAFSVVHNITCLDCQLSFIISMRQLSRFLLTVTFALNITNIKCHTPILYSWDIIAYVQLLYIKNYVAFSQLQFEFYFNKVNLKFYRINCVSLRYITN